MSYLIMINIGNINNNQDPTTGLGEVSYKYNISKYHITILDYISFLNAVEKTDLCNISGSTAVTIKIDLKAQKVIKI